MRAKFYVTSMSDSKGTFTVDGEHVEKELISITMFPVYANKDGSKNDENGKYWNATPAGSIQLSVVNKAAVEALSIKPGDELYVDFTKVK